MGRLPEVYIASPAQRKLRELVHHRAKLVALRSAQSPSARVLQNSLLPECLDVFGQEGMAWLRSAPLDLVYRQLVNSSLKLIDAYDGLSSRPEDCRSVHRTPGVSGHLAISGVGLTFAAIFIAEIGEIGRFAGRRS